MPVGEVLAELLYLCDAPRSGEPVLPRFVGHLEQDDLVLAAAHDEGVSDQVTFAGALNFAIWRLNA